jgi:cysteine desulfurase
VGKIVIDLQQTPVDFIVSSAHKFHGPKGIGFAYIKKGLPMRPLFFGGEQEKGLRPGTESLHNVVGMAKALEISYSNLDDESSFIAELKNYCITQLSVFFPDFITVGENCCVGILNVILPISQEKAAMLLFHLDMKGIAVSRGSACQSGSSKPSHVLAEILDLENCNKPNLRISFSSFNTKSDIDYLMASLVAIAL